MGTEISLNKEILRLEGGYLDVLKDAITLNNRLHAEDRGILNRNTLLMNELNHIMEDSILPVYRTNLPKFIYLLIEDFASLKTENDKLRHDFKKEND